MKNTDIQTLIQKYFLQRLMAQRNVSPETIKSYRDTFRLYLRYTETHCGVSPSKMSIAHFDADHILGFLSHLDKERGNSAKTINNRLAALHSFAKYLIFELPEYSGLLSRSLKVPFRKDEKRQMEFLTEDEFAALKSACETSTALGRRDTGRTWAVQQSVADNQWYSVVYGNGLFVAVANSGSGNRVMTSPDGITWTARQSAADNYWNGVTYGNGLFVAVAGGTNNRVMTSPDGITWTARQGTANNNWYSVTYGNGLFVAVTTRTASHGLRGKAQQITIGMASASIICLRCCASPAANANRKLRSPWSLRGWKRCLSRAFTSPNSLAR